MGVCVCDVEVGVGAAAREVAMELCMKRVEGADLSKVRDVPLDG